MFIILINYQKRFRFNSSGVVLGDADVLALVLLLEVIGDQVARVLFDCPSENRLLFYLSILKQVLNAIFIIKKHYFLYLT